MSVDLGLAILVIALAVAFVGKTLVFVPPERRGIVERLGRFHRLLPPGWNVIVPFLERQSIVEPDSLLPGWRGYGETELRRKLVAEFYAQGAPGLLHPLEKAAAEEARRAAEKAAGRR